MPFIKISLFYIALYSEVIPLLQCSITSAHQVAESLYDVKLLLHVTLNYLTVGDRHLHMNRNLPEENLFITSQQPPNLHQSTKKIPVWSWTQLSTGQGILQWFNSALLSGVLWLQYVLEEWVFLACNAKRHSLLLINHHLQINPILRGECYLFSKEFF